VRFRFLQKDRDCFVPEELPRLVGDLDDDLKL